MSNPATRLSEIVIPHHETIVEFPSRLLRLLPPLDDGPQA